MVSHINEFSVHQKIYGYYSYGYGERYNGALTWSV